MKPIILLVDDNKDILEFLEHELTKEYTIVKALNGRDALIELEKEIVQLVVSDIMMPVMNGLELCRNIKNHFDYSHIPIILLTAKNTLQSRIEGLEFGADAYIEKPFSPDHLRMQISNLLDNRNKIKTYFANSPFAHIKSIAHSKADELFLEKINESIYASLNNSTFDVEKLAKTMNMSRATLHRKIKSISGLTPNELINITRLKKSAELLIDGRYKVYEIAEMVGYGSTTNFGRNFNKQFGMTASDYVLLSKHQEDKRK